MLIKLNKFQDLKLLYTEIFWSDMLITKYINSCCISLFWYIENSIQSSDIWILRYTENKNI